MAMQQEPIEDGGTDSIFLAYISGVRKYPSKIWPEKWYVYVPPF
jgi:hypothetical protein